MDCTKCGAPLADGVLSCGQCGTAVAPRMPPQGPGQPTEPPTVQSPTVQSPTAQPPTPQPQAPPWGPPPVPGPPQYGQPQQYGQAPQYGQPPQYGQAPQYGQPQQYGQPAAVPYPYGQGAADPGNGFSVTAIVLGAVSFLFCPLVLGITAIVFAAVARSRRERLANVALAVSIAGTVIGMVLGVIVYSSFSSFG
ncbi:MAG: zinc-ribbon domain-containing protein [Microthrixaceae bacterium]|nr:hypothetical protein [Microthrixaceae bacterium]MCB1011594.1 hypothetical protein [Microthrixaceae bacterium]MCO5319864.1 zinc-ribbon domain-containing protein [Microthrixaceae bacterium]